MSNTMAECRDTRKCFATVYYGGMRWCKALGGPPYKNDGDCPFCKEEREVTNGKVYPFNPDYEER